MALKGLDQAVSYDLNAALTADADAAVAAATDLRLMGWQARESDGTPAVATFEIVHGADGSADDAVIPVELAANQSKGAWYGPQGLDFPDGISIDHIAGTFDVTLFFLRTNPGA